MSSLLFIVIGFPLLLKSADWLVEGATVLAARRGISQLAIGLTVVSFGTSLPEMLVTQVSTLQGYTGLAIGNIIGSNVANILLVLGIAALVRPLPVKDSTVLSEIPFSLAAALLLGFLANAALLSEYRELTISRLDGCIMLGFFLLFLLYVYKISTEDHTELEVEVKEMTQLRAWGLIVLGVAGLYLGGQWVVEGAIAFTRMLNLSESLVGLTVVAVGTSLPELIASAVAAYKGKADMAVGNVVGSNIFNILWVLGLAAVFRELPFDVLTNTDILMVILSSTLLIIALVTPQRGVVDRIDGGLLVLGYFVYLVMVIQRG